MRNLEDIPLHELLERLYSAEINCGIASFWDMGYRVWIGDADNGIKAERYFSVGKGENDEPTWNDMWQAVSVWLHETAENFYPNWDAQRASDETP